jgi:hypothetical protein
MRLRVILVAAEAALLSGVVVGYLASDGPATRFPRSIDVAVSTPRVAPVLLSIDRAAVTTSTTVLATHGGRATGSTGQAGYRIFAARPATKTARTVRTTKVVRRTALIGARSGPNGDSGLAGVGASAPAGSRPSSIGASSGISP